MKVLIYQVNVPQPWDKPANKPLPAYVEESVEGWRRYASTHGMDYSFESEPTFSPEEIPKDTDWRMQFYWSMALCKPELRHYDYIVHFDADIIVKEGAPDIREELRGDFMAVRDPIDYMGLWNHHIIPLRKAFAFRNVSDHFGYPWYDHFNSGVWVSSPKARELIWENWQQDAFKSYEEKCLINTNSTGKYFNVGGKGTAFGLGDPYGGDQNILNDIVHNSDLEFNSIDWRWNALSAGFKVNHIDEAHAIHYGGRVGKFLYAYPEYRRQLPLDHETVDFMNNCTSFERNEVKDKL